MVKPVLQTCCRCGTLRGGSIVWGVLGIISSILMIVTLFVTNIQFATIAANWLSPLAVKIILTINFIMTIIISILMIVGVVKRNFYLMMPWVVLGLPLAFGILISIIYNVVILFIGEYYPFGVVFLIPGLLIFALYIYMWLVVFSFFSIIREENQRGRYNQQPYRR